MGRVFAKSRARTVFFKNKAAFGKKSSVSTKNRVHCAINSQYLQKHFCACETFDSNGQKHAVFHQSRTFSGKNTRAITQKSSCAGKSRCAAAQFCTREGKKKEFVRKNARSADYVVGIENLCKGI